MILVRFKHIIKILILIFAIFGRSEAVLFAQENSTYIESKIELSEFNQEKWEKARDGLNYDNEVRKEEEQTDPIVKPPRKSFFGDGKAMKIAFYVVFILIMLGLIVYIFGNKYIFSNTKVGPKKTFSIENIEQNLKEADIDGFLKDSLKTGNYKLAIRLYYLKIIKELSLVRWIKWRKEKTNYDYMMEMRKRENFQAFKQVTKIFDKVWYGDIEVELSDYDRVAPIFERFLKGIK